MADIEKLNDVEDGDIEKVNGVAKTSIEAINGAEIPASGAALWCIAGQDGGVATAAASNLNSWTGYVSADMSTQDYICIAFGRNDSGNPLWVVGSQNATKEIRYSTDPTAGVDAWTDVNIDHQMRGLAYAGLDGSDQVWVGVGASGKMWRSTDGAANWTEVDISGLANKTSLQIDEIVTDGSGNMIFGQDTRIYHSTDHGESWAQAIDLADSPHSVDSAANIHSCAYTNGKWMVFLRKSGLTNVFYASSPTGTWALCTVDGSAASGTNLCNAGARRMAAANGTAIIVVGDNVARSTNSGVDWTYTENALPNGSARDVYGDGNGNWVAVHDSGRVSISTDNGANWAEQSGVQDGGSNTNLRFPTGGSNIEDLDAVCCDVILPI